MMRSKNKKSRDLSLECFKFGFNTRFYCLFTRRNITTIINHPDVPQIKAKNQLRVNGLSFLTYFLSYFIVLIGLMAFICMCIIGIIFIFNVPSLQEPPALMALGILLMMYCPSSIIFSTCLSYMFDKMDSAQSLLPNIATFFGLVPFILVMVVDMLGLGK